VTIGAEGVAVYAGFIGVGVGVAEIATVTLGVAGIAVPFEDVATVVGVGPVGVEFEGAVVGASAVGDTVEPGRDSDCGPSLRSSRT